MKYLVKFIETSQLTNLLIFRECCPHCRSKTIKKKLIYCRVDVDLQVDYLFIECKPGITSGTNSKGLVSFEPSAKTKQMKNQID